MFELRYVVRNSSTEPVQVLQYRTQKEVADYSAMNPRTGDYIKKMEWTNWQDVPVVNETK